MLSSVPNSDPFAVSAYVSTHVPYYVPRLDPSFVVPGLVPSYISSGLPSLTPSAATSSEPSLNSYALPSYVLSLSSCAVPSSAPSLGPKSSYVMYLQRKKNLYNIKNVFTNFDGGFSWLLYQKQDDNKIGPAAAAQVHLSTHSYKLVLFFYSFYM